MTTACACGGVPVAVFCFTENRFLCATCDASTHLGDGAAHDRVAANAGVAPPSCDICRAAPAALLCCEDRAVMCRGCDLTVHGANGATQSHLRLPLPSHQLGFASLADGGGGGDRAAGGGGATAAEKGKARAPAPAPRPPPAPAAGAPPHPSAAGPGGSAFDDLWAPSAPGATLAAELLGLPPDALGAGFSAKDVDAAYLLPSDGPAPDDIDADLASILEVPDIDFYASLAGPSGGGGALLAAAGAPAVGRRGRDGDGDVDGVVPDVGPAKRTRA